MNKIATLFSLEKQSTHPISNFFIIKSITNAMLELKNKFNISSFKPHLNYYECHVNLVINAKLNIPIKMYFFLSIKKESSSETIPDNILSFMHKSGFNILWLRLKLVKLFIMINTLGKSVLRWVIFFLNCKMSLTSLLLYKRVRFKLLLLIFNNIKET